MDEEAQEQREPALLARVGKFLPALHRALHCALHVLLPHNSKVHELLTRPFVQLVDAPSYAAAMWPLQISFRFVTLQAWVQFKLAVATDQLIDLPRGAQKSLVGIALTVVCG